jgi:hypothetical protein
MKLAWKTVALTGLFCALFGALAGAQLGSILKGGAVAAVVSKFGPDINKFINRVTGEKNAGPEQATKVVPILSVGNGGYIGAVQVAGPRSKVNLVQAVGQIEGNFKLVGGVRIRALIPISNKTPQKGIRRVNGVGVSAIVDLKL